MQCYPNDIDEELDYSGSNICVIKSKESLEKIISESVKTNGIVNFLILFFPLNFLWNVTPRPS